MKNKNSIIALLIGVLLLFGNIINAAKPVYTSPIYQVSTNNAYIIYNNLGQPLYFYDIAVPPRGIWMLRKSYDLNIWFDYSRFVVKNGGFKTYQLYVDPNEGVVYYQFVPSL